LGVIVVKDVSNSMTNILKVVLFWPI